MGSARQEAWTSKEALPGAYSGFMSSPRVFHWLGKTKLRTTAGCIMVAAYDARFKLTSPLDADARRLALEVIATLAYVKKIAADQILRPAGVPTVLIQHFVKGRRTTATGDPLTKRQGGAHILEELAKTGADHEVVRKVVGIAANWTSFHLASNEYDARGVVQKARELVGTIADADERERRRQEQSAKERAERADRERQTIMRQGSKLLLAQFDTAMAGDERQERGYLLFEDLSEPSI